ncbi:MAG: DNA repair protein RadA [Myxococcales bacterium]|nr:DNA repair protein RadA [Myxococcales bacterium]MCB9642983.1 DNA repair protein RadA [Myxococcales bacterium]
MAKAKVVYECSGCGSRTPKWLGRCPDCGAWNSYVELTEAPQKSSHEARRKQTLAQDDGPTPLTDVKEVDASRYRFLIKELDRVLGGGLVPGSLILLGGDPGIGKSTIAMQAAAQMARNGKKVLYVSGEESLPQAHMRAKRLGMLHENILMLAEVDVEHIRTQVQRVKPSLLIVDSIQSVYCPEVTAAPGAISQIRESTSRFLHLAKREAVPTLLIGHVTKDGAIAGPRVLEHMVDTVLYFEGDRGHPYRILRAVKNRFGSTNEIGVFEMKEDGLQEVGNPSALFLDQRPLDAPGSVVTVCIEGSRPMLVEVQALVGTPVYGTPRRTCTGVDPNRVALLVAVLEKSGGMQIASADIFVNVAGGYRLDEPAADLAVAMALASSFRGRAVPQDMAIFGELGLAGEVRGISQAETRAKEAVKLGFSKVMLPEHNRASLPQPKKAKFFGAKRLDDALDALFSREV